jgi:outer membrane protein assembly factor BamB
MSDVKGSQRGTRVASLLLALTLAACAAINPFSGPSKPKPKIGGERVSVLSFDTKLEPDERLADLQVNLPEAQRNAEWPQPGGVPSHALGSLAAPENLKLIWSVTIGHGGGKGSRVTTGPIVAGGKIIAMDTDVRLSAYDAKTGRGLWRTSLAISAEKPEVGFGGGATYDNGKLFASTGFGDVFALKPEDGSIIWRAKIGEAFRSPPIAADGRVYVTSVENAIHVLDEADGKTLWTYRAISEGVHILSSTTPAISGDAVVAPFTSGELVAFLARNGSAIWSDSLTRTGRFSSMTTLNDIAGDPVIEGGWAFAVSHSGRMVAIDLRSGQRVWSQEIPSVQTPWVAGDFIFVVTTNAEVLCIYRRDGGIKWLTQLKAFSDSENKKPIVWNGPLLLGDRLFLASSKHRATMISATTGKVLQEFKIEDQIFSRPIVADGIVYMLTNTGKLLAYGDPALRKGARPSSPKTTHVAKAEAGEIVKVSQPFWDLRVPSWFPVF